MSLNWSLLLEELLSWLRGLLANEAASDESYEATPYERKCGNWYIFSKVLADERDGCI